MKELKVFIASSNELSAERVFIGALAGKLDTMLREQGIRIKLFEWEDFDAAYNGRRKQDEYNDNVRDSDVFFALFMKKLGAFTVEEYHVAAASFAFKGRPEVHVLVKEKNGGEPSVELRQFLCEISSTKGTTVEKFSSIDEMQYLFVKHIYGALHLNASWSEEAEWLCIGSLRVSKISSILKEKPSIIQ